MRLLFGKTCEYSSKKEKKKYSRNEIFSFTDKSPTETKKQGSSKNNKENTSAELSIEKEKPLGNTLQSVLGNDPTSSKAKKVQIHSNLIQHWNYYAIKGLGKEDRKSLMNKFVIPTKLQAPNLNEQLIAKLNEKLIKQNNYRYETQKMISVALTAIGSAITMANDEEDGLDQEEFLEKLTDAAKAMADIQFQLSETRRAFITPRFSKPFQEILKSAKPDQLLYGTELASKIKETKEANTLLKDIAVDPPQKFQGKTGNWKRPLAMRNSYNRAGYTNAPGQDRPKIYFKKYQRNYGRTQNQNQYQNQKPRRFQKNM